MSDGAGAVQRQGMTGFGRAGGEADWGVWTVEAKSVNGRGLDVRVNSPPGFDVLDQVARSGAKARFSRGNVQIGIRIDMAESTDAISVDEAALAVLMKAWKAASDADVWPSGETIAALMAIKGVVNTGTAGNGLRELAGDAAAIATLSTGIETALDAMKAARLTEGETLRGVLTGLLAQMDSARGDAEALAGDVPSELKAKLEARISDLGGVDRLEPGRLESELVLLAQRADVREELDRLKAHIESGRGLLATEGAIGRQLDFLAQELMREANTLCSKSANLKLTECGLSLKVLVDQFKEQAANVE